MLFYSYYYVCDKIKGSSDRIETHNRKKNNEERKQGKIEGTYGAAKG